MWSIIICDKNSDRIESLYKLLCSIYRGKFNLIGRFNLVEPLDFSYGRRT